MSNLPTPPSSEPPIPPPPADDGSHQSSSSVALALVAVAVIALAGGWYLTRDTATVGTPATQGTGLAGTGSGTPPAVAKPATLTVTTTPPGATVILDDTIIGASPVAARPLTNGRHAVRCEKDGFTPMVQTADAAVGANNLQFTLQPVAYAELSVASTPDGAEVLVDGEFKGRTPATVTKLTPGPHDLVIKKDNFTTYQGRQTLHAGEKKQLTDVVLKDKLLDMLQELVNTDPRAISNHLDLAHYYYINNRMADAAREYVRVNELASLPMELLPPDATQAEKEQIQTTYQWDKDRVRHEIDKHVKSYREYFGGNLDFNGFLKAYKDGSAVRWDIKNFDWVMTEAERQLGAGNSARAVELFADAQVLNPKSVTAAAGLARSFAANDNLREALPLADRTTQTMAKTELSKEDQALQATAWRFLATADLLAAAKSPSTDQPALLRAAEEALKNAETFCNGDKKDDYERAWVLYERAQWAGLQHDAKARLDTLTAAFAAAKANSENDKTKNHLERNRNQCEQFAIELAWAKLQAGLKDEATTLWQDLVHASDKDSLTHKRAQEILDDLAQGKTPMEK
ncbi:MAG TPA: PEGA domain-containing protein [Planctomycetota bacterium]|nr:PEGA domain-containing protein [Planctomycetota bacterium]